MVPIRLPLDKGLKQKISMFILRLRDKYQSQSPNEVLSVIYGIVPSIPKVTGDLLHLVAEIYPYWYL